MKTMNFQLYSNHDDPWRAVWIYKPRSGPKTLIVKPSSRVAVAEWPNGSLHVIGHVVRLAWLTVRPNNWWRTVARRAAEDIIRQLGEGVAYDAGGYVGLVVARDYAASAFWLMEVIAPAYTAEREDEMVRNLSELYRAGAARIEFRDYRVALPLWKDAMRSIASQLGIVPGPAIAAQDVIVPGVLRHETLGEGTVYGGVRAIDLYEALAAVAATPEATDRDVFDGRSDRS